MMMVNHPHRSKQQQAQHTPGLSLIRRLRETTRLMASRITAPQGLWNEHSNTCLQAADAIDQLETLNAELLAALKRLERTASEIADYLREIGHSSSNLEIARDVARAAIAKAEGRATLT